MRRCVTGTGSGNIVERRSSDSVPSPVVHLALLLLVLSAQVWMEFRVDGDHETVQPVLNIHIVLEIYIHALAPIDTIVINASNHISRA